MHFRRAVVIGAGVSGLTTALSLQKLGLEVDILTELLPPETTSQVAAAFWYPYLVEPAEKASRWGEASYHQFESLAADPASGILLRPLRVLFQKPVSLPAWSHYVKDFAWLSSQEIPSGFCTGYRLLSSVIEMPIYLAYLQQQLATSGVHIRQAKVTSLNDAQLDSADVIINCTGLGARELCHDQAMFPVRGQILAGQGIPADEITFCPEPEAGPIYIVPRSHDCIVGGTSDMSGDLTPSEKTSDAIWNRALKITPALRSLTQLVPRVGLRPCRTQVRLEAEKTASGKLVIHNYGHGGGGVTLSWGCAKEVTELLLSAS
ncbi:MAG: FAD-dependent oxidoreductase [Pirellulales bacterium]